MPFHSAKHRRREPTRSAGGTDPPLASKSLPDIWPVLPLALIVSSLFLLALLPILVERQVSALRREMLDVAVPARTVVRVIEVSLALEAADARADVLNGAENHVRRHRAARRARMQAVSALAGLSARSSPALRELTAKLQRQLRPTDALLDSLDEGLLPREQGLLRLRGQRQELEQAAATAQSICATIDRYDEQRLVAIHAAERAVALLSLLLVALALVAGFMVLRLGMAYRALALREGAARAESEAARAQDEWRRTEGERLSESRERLVRGFTHDVKNPLGAALGYLELLEQELIQPKQAHRRIRRTIELALVLIDELLQLARVEAGLLEICDEPVDLLQVAREAADDYRARADAKGLALQVQALDAVPPVRTDPARVAQILGNLIGNAVKYTPAGHVAVRVGFRPDAPDRWVAVHVTDTGPGLPADELELLFQEFHRLGSSSGTAGTGLGLAISRRLARLLGGDIVVHSVPGAGSTFTLLLPILGGGRVLAPPATALDEPVPPPAAPP